MGSRPTACPHGPLSAQRRVGIVALREQEPALVPRLIDPPGIGVLVIAVDEEERDLLTLVLRRHGAQVAAVAILPRDTAEERKRARNAGFDVHVTKPLSPHGLIEALRNAVGLD